MECLSKTPIRCLRSVLLLGLSVLGLLRVTNVQAAPPSAKADIVVNHVLAAPARSGAMGVVIRLNGGLTATQEKTLRALGGDIYRHLPIIHSVALHIPIRHLNQLTALPFVQRIASDAPVKKCDEFTVASSGADIAFTQQNLTGYGVSVAVVDSGVTASSPDLTGRANGLLRVTSSPSFAPGITTQVDQCGHGTHIAGIIAGNGSASSLKSSFRTFYGIARRASIVSVKVLDGAGNGSVSSAISGIQWVINNKASYNIRVMNLSLGHPVGGELHD